MNAGDQRVTVHPVVRREITRAGDDMSAPRLQSRRHVLGIVVALALGVSGCGGAAPPDTADAAPAVAQVPQGDSDVGGSTQQGRNSEPSVDDSTGETSDATQQRGSAPRTQDDAGASTAAQTQAQSPRDSANASNGNDVAAKPAADAAVVTASVDPTCVRPRETITITVASEPQASVAYNAIYADGESGASPPYGNGYGGNSGGIAGEDGRYADTWMVAANAPSGWGRVEVVVGTPAGFGKTAVDFAVADPVTGKCDR